ncbi:hypothetical protein NDU88_004140 [Pleurodeles waltl]|uniref:Uncharacterized protein n=1 Tax=Pleurodeles waltl TaxID=8319 RepID=A0AAV7MSM1_PLEWA|nr:hypothetical protein NDU88_004140 [Pleurodeles waltl]
MSNPKVLYEIFSLFIASLPEYQDVSSDGIPILDIHNPSFGKLQDIFYKESDYKGTAPFERGVQPILVIGWYLACVRGQWDLLLTHRTRKGTAEVHPSEEDIFVALSLETVQPPNRMDGQAGSSESFRKPMSRRVFAFGGKRHTSDVYQALGERMRVRLLLTPLQPAAEEGRAAGL